MRELLAKVHLRFELTPSDPYKTIKIPVRQLGIAKVVIVRKGSNKNVSTLQRARKRDYIYRISDVLPIRKVPSLPWKRRVMNDLVLIVMGGWAIASFVGCLVAIIVWSILKELGKLIVRGFKRYGW